MEKIARRTFCGATILALPLLCLRAQGDEEPFDQSDAVLDTLADEVSRIAADGAQNGFKAEHFRRCAGVIRTFDACLEEEGTNRRLNSRLDDDDFYMLNPSLTAQKTVDYWSKHGLHLDKDDLTARLAMDGNAYRETKRNIKKLGGVRALHASTAGALDRKATEYEASAFKEGPGIRKDRLALASSSRSRRAGFMPVQLDLGMLVGADLDCLCGALIVEGALLALTCVVGCGPCCIPAVFLLALEKFLEGIGLCTPANCS
jgi:hypothetical protein